MTVIDARHIFPNTKDIYCRFLTGQPISVIAEAYECPIHVIDGIIRRAQARYHPKGGSTSTPTSTTKSETGPDNI